MPWPDLLNHYINIRQRQGEKEEGGALWPMSSQTAYRLLKRVMVRANIAGPQATGKGLRRGFGVAMVTAAKSFPIHILAKAMGHSSTKTTEIYLQVIGQEERGLFLAAWE
jgi:integrase/recombinase XerD